MSSLRYHDASIQLPFRMQPMRLAGGGDGALIARVEAPLAVAVEAESQSTPAITPKGRAKNEAGGRQQQSKTHHYRRHDDRSSDDKEQTDDDAANEHGE